MCPGQSLCLLRFNILFLFWEEGRDDGETKRSAVKLDSAAISAECFSLVETRSSDVFGRFVGEGLSASVRSVTHTERESAGRLKEQRRARRVHLLPPDAELDGRRLKAG